MEAKHLERPLTFFFIQKGEQSFAHINDTSYNHQEGDVNPQLYLPFILQDFTYLSHVTRKPVFRSLLYTR